MLHIQPPFGGWLYGLLILIALCGIYRNVKKEGNNE